MVSVFKKLFGSKDMPTNDGSRADIKKPERVRWIKKFSLQLTNMEGSPSYGLTHQLTVGSEVGNIIIADPSVSPRHCSFILQDEVVSVIDHGSMTGTIVNNQKIPDLLHFIHRKMSIFLWNSLCLEFLHVTAELSVRSLWLPASADSLVGFHSLVQNLQSGFSLEIILGDRRKWGENKFHTNSDGHGGWKLFVIHRVTLVLSCIFLLFGFFRENVS
jgi:hypothetical protein